MAITFFSAELCHAVLVSHYAPNAGSRMKGIPRAGGHLSPTNLRVVLVIVVARNSAGYWL